MKVALSPIEFANRARRVYADNEAVVDGDLRLTYKEFFKRCDRWSFALQKMGVESTDRVAYIAPNTHSHLEAYYSVPQIGAVLVPINYRLSADEFEYIINHSGAKVLCVHPDYFDLIDSIKSKLSHVQNFIALEGDKVGWSNYEKILTESDEEFCPVEIDEDDLITINYTSGTTARPKGVMITHRNAYM
ncbi:MAG: AMP-binding protein, partial [Alphaproteobacteria bacterium]|nr:AMP-binding protein [Alphaproteobacteria bacterium]